MFEIGDRIVWTVGPVRECAVHDGLVTKISSELVWVGHQHKPEDCIYRGLCFPFRVGPQLREIVAERARLQKIADDSTDLILKLRHAITRGEV